MKSIALREPVNFFTHVFPALTAIPAAFFLLQRSETTMQLTAALIYGFCTFTLFTISAVYHGFASSERSIRMWQKFDHCCIYLMIAGSYTPTALLVFGGWMKWGLFGMIWFIAFLGCILKLSDRLQHKGLSLTVYISMGCLIIPLLNRMSAALPWQAIAWMLAGGIFYIGGTYFYYQDRPYKRFLHSHEIWHLFVIGGAVCHYVYNYVYLFG
jgi:hemolysin III